MSSSTPAISVAGLSKAYRLGVEGAATTFREAIVRRVARRNGSESQAVIWALRNVSLEIARGETVGIIGQIGRAHV